MLSVETQELKYKEYSQGLDPDKNFWTENGKYIDSYIVMVRIFYISGATTYEEIGECTPLLDAELTKTSYTAL